MLGGEGNIQRESNVTSSPHIIEYLEGLNLLLVTDMIQNREAGLLLPPSKKHKLVPPLVFEKVQGSVWGTKLYGEEHGDNKSGDKGKKGRQRTSPSSLTQESNGTSVPTLESDLNPKIQEANARRKEDAATAKRELEKQRRGYLQSSRMCSRNCKTTTGVSCFYTRVRCILSPISRCS